MQQGGTTSQPPLPRKRQGWITLPVVVEPYLEKLDWGSTDPGTISWRAHVENYGIDHIQVYGETWEEALMHLITSITDEPTEFTRLYKEAHDWMK